MTTDAQRRRNLYRDQAMQGLRGRSGQVDGARPVVEFLYLLMRDHLPTGVVEKLVLDCATLAPDGDTVCYTNGWLAEYANDLANRLAGYTKPEDMRAVGQAAEEAGVHERQMHLDADQFAPAETLPMPLPESRPGLSM